MVASPLLPEAPPGQRSQLEALVGERFGLTLSRYADSLVRALLASLPGDLSAPDEAVLGRLVAACSIGETMFMRHPEQLHTLAGLLPALQEAAPGRALRVWSAGCATGEEAYSLAGVTHAHAGPPVEVLGTDLNPESIAVARQARYRHWSMRGVQLEDVADWCRLEGTQLEVLPHVRSRVRFAVHNLMDGAPEGPFDAVFCRNVLLYFREDMAARVLELMAQGVRPGGLLFLGPFDLAPLPDGAWREVRGVGGPCYRRVGGEDSPLPWAVPALQALPRAAPPPPRPAAPRPVALRPVAPRRPLAQARVALARVALARVEPARVEPARVEPARVEPARVEPVEQASEAAAALESELEGLLARVRALCGRGDYAPALRLLAEASRDWPLALAVHVLEAMVADEAGLSGRLLEAARRASCLSPLSPMAQYLLGLGLLRAGEARRAADCFQRAREALALLPDLTLPLPHGEGLTGTQLRRMIDAQSGTP